MKFVFACILVLALMSVACEVVSANNNHQNQNQNQQKQQQNQQKNNAAGAQNAKNGQGSFLPSCFSNNLRINLLLQDWKLQSRQLPPITLKLDLE
ncbi:hypothetical protein TNCV_1294941 [Trichonephila clavipes]|nr:hypothetical protein TNCV_1294941 [Trichonephila clavipes]